ncbi:MAG: hypothetical protein V4696_07550 [Pseudomonadota bacterium]
MTCPTVSTFQLKNDLDAIARIPLSDRATISSLEFHPALLLIDHPAAHRFRQAVSIRRHQRSMCAWTNADAFHPAIYRALRVDQTDPAAFYACFPFRLAKIEDQHVILAAFAPPAFGSDDQPDIIVAWEPRDNRHSIIGDNNPQIIMPDHPETECDIYGDFFAFARAWVEKRAAFYQLRMDQVAGKWQHPVTEPRDGNLPGILAIGDVSKIRLPRDLPPVLNAVGIDRKAMNSAIMRSANLPRVTDQNIRIAA